MAIEIDTNGAIGGGGVLAAATGLFTFFKWRQDAAAKREEANAKREETTVGQYILIVNALQADIVRLNVAHAVDSARHGVELQAIQKRLDEEMERRTRDWEAANAVRNTLSMQINHVLKWCATQGYAPPEMAPDGGSNLYPSLQSPKPKAPKESP